MAIGDIKREALTRFTADNSGLIGKIKENERATKEFADKSKESLDRVANAVEKIEKTYNSLGEAYKRMSSTATAALGLVDKVMGAVNANASRMALESAAAGRGLGSIEQASAGLITRQRELEFAAKLNTSAFKLSAAQYTDAANAVRELVREGANQEEAIKKVGEAITKFDGGPLQDFGIRTRQGTTDSEKFAAVMEALHEKALKVGDGTKTAGEEVAAYGVATENAMDKIYKSIDRVISKLGPAIEKAAELIDTLLPDDRTRGNVASLAFTAAFDSDGAAVYTPTRAQYDAQNKATAARMAASGAIPRSSVPGGSQYLDPSTYGAAFAKLLAPYARGIAKAYDPWATGNAPGTGEELGTPIRDLVHSLNGLNDSLRERVRGAAQSVNTGLENLGDSARSRDAIARAQAKFGTIGPDEHDDNRPLDAQKLREQLDAVSPRAKATTYLESVFGKKEEFDAYKELIGGLASTVTTAYDAWSSGAMSAGQAAQAAVKQTLQAFGHRMMVRSIEELAEGFAALAIGGPLGGASASQHFTSAAIFGAGAIAAGVGSRALTPSSAASGAAAAPMVTRSSGGGGDGTKSTTIVVGDSFAEDSPRMRQLRAEDLVKRAGIGDGGRDE